jgi:hypothetical protein
VGFVEVYLEVGKAFFFFFSRGSVDLFFFLE